MLGFLYGRGEEQLLQAAKKLPVKPTPGQNILPQFVYNAAPDRSFLSGARLADPCEAADSPEERARLLTQRTELIYLLGHSNGLDEGIGDIVLCRKDSCPAEPDDLAVLPCFHGGPCPRTAPGGVHRMCPGEIGAQRVINLTCWGIPIAGKPFAPRFSVGEGLLLSAGVEALITTIRVTDFYDSELLLMYYLCNAGFPFGAVANKVNQYRMKTNRLAEILCFGDPLSQLSPIVHHVAGEKREDRAWAVRLPRSLDKATDFGAYLPEMDAIHNPLILDLTPDASLMAAVLDPPDTLYFTVLRDSDAAEFKFKLIHRDTVTQIPQEHLRLLQDLDFFAISFPRLIRSPLERKPIRAVSKLLEEIKARLRSWPLAHMGIGSKVHIESLAELYFAPTKLLALLIDKLLDFYGKFMSKYTGLHSKYWHADYQFSHLEANIARCPYCGCFIDEIVFEKIIRKESRRLGNCDGCGLVYDGRSELPRWVKISDNPIVGSALAISLKVKNPYSLTVPAGVVAVLENGSSEQKCISRIGPEMIGTDEGSEAEFLLKIPGAPHKGVYYLSVAILVGAKINFLRRPIEVAAAGQGLAAAMTSSA